MVDRICFGRNRPFSLESERSTVPRPETDRKKKPKGGICMKRLWILALALCMTALFCVGTLGLGAEDTNTDIWFVYSMKENDKGSPLFSLPPAYEYTSEGLRVTPHEKMESYTAPSVWTMGCTWRSSWIRPRSLVYWSSICGIRAV